MTGDEAIIRTRRAYEASAAAWAGRGFAMAHSDRYALDAADEVLDNGDDPVAKLLEELVASR